MHLHLQLRKMLTSFAGVSRRDLNQAPASEEGSSSALVTGAGVAGARSGAVLGAAIFGTGAGGGGGGGGGGASTCGRRSTGNSPWTTSHQIKHRILPSTNGQQLLM